MKKKIKDLLLNFSQESMLACMTYCIKLQLDTLNPKPVMYTLQSERKLKAATPYGILQCLVGIIYSASLRA